MVEDNWNFFMSSTVEFVTSCLCFYCDFLMVLLTIFFFFLNVVIWWRRIGNFRTSLKPKLRLLLMVVRVL